MAADTNGSVSSIDPEKAKKTTSLMNVLGHILISLVLLYFFLVGVSLLGGSIKLMGGDFAKTLFGLTTNPFISLFAGILATALFQSSSVTTSIIVGLVSSGTLPLGGAVPMIMGANIGTSVTNTFVSLGSVKNSEEFKRSFAAATVHDFFNFMSVGLLLPIELATGFLQKTATALSGMLYGSSAGMSYSSPIKAAIKPPVKMVKNFVVTNFESIGGVLMMILSFVVIITALTLVVKNMRKLVEHEASQYIDKALGHPVIAMMFGIGMTIAVQSSSITTSLLVPMAGAGMLTLPTIFPVTVGANIGTTATALLAALTGNIHGLTIALVHFLFNISGMLIWFTPKTMRKLPIAAAEKFAELTAKNKLYAVAYVAIAFFILPVGLIFLTK